MTAATATCGLLVGDVDGSFWSTFGSGGEQLRVRRVHDSEVVNVCAETSAYQRGSEVFCKRHAVAMLQRGGGGGTPPPLPCF